MSKSEKDWTGNYKSTYSTLGASNHTPKDREVNDYYATEPIAATLLMNEEKFAPVIWECACGEGHLSKEFEKVGYEVISTDIVDRGYGAVQDFLAAEKLPCEFGCDIVTNPPYSKAAEFIEHAMKITMPGTKIAMFLKLQFLEGKSRKSLFQLYPPPACVC